MICQFTGGSGAQSQFFVSDKFEMCVFISTGLDPEVTVVVDVSLSSLQNIKDTGKL